MNIWKLLPAVALLALPFVARADDTNSVAATNAVSPFDQAMVDYQDSIRFGYPSLDALKNVIKMTEAMDKLPPTPEEARRHFVRGEALFQDATNNPEGFAPAIKEFAEAVKLAPWVRNIRYNLALAYEANNEYKHAIHSLESYLLFKLPDDEARAVQDKIYALEVKAEKAEKKKAEEQRVADAEQAEKDKREATMNAFVGDWATSSSYRMTFSIKRSDDGSFTIRFVNRGMNADLFVQDVKFDGKAICYKMDSIGHKLILNKNGCLIDTYYGNNNGLDSSPGHEFRKE